MDPTLAMLSAQTATNPQYSDADLNYDQYAYRAPETAVPHMAAPVSIPTQQYSSQQPPQLFRTQAVNYARPVAAASSTLYLAQACGNCARSYGDPLVCAALKIEVSPLSVCANFCSPLDIT